MAGLGLKVRSESLEMHLHARHRQAIRISHRHVGRNRNELRRVPAPAVMPHIWTPTVGGIIKSHAMAGPRRLEFGGTASQAQSCSEPSLGHGEDLRLGVDEAKSWA